MKLGYKYLFAAVVLLFIFTEMTLSQGKPEIKVIAYDGYIRISWEMPNNSEAGVDHYEVWRSSGISASLPIAKVARGTFYFNDINLYKAEVHFFSYQVKAIGSNSTLQSTSDPFGISYAGTNDTYKRTWGSIKAMFR